ncbi:MAG TPA: hypothetical protein VHE30_17630 [Polyangiaceae bacterium]|nr:hypothetical protein [Polyangiaceae bacterium]
MRHAISSLAALLATLACEAHLDVLAARSGATDGGGASQDSAGPPPGVVDVSAGFAETCAVIGSALACWGTLPDGHVSSVPETIAGGGKGAWERISSGQRAHCGVELGGSLWCFGLDDQGQLAQGDTTARAAPAPVPLPGAATRVRGHFATFCAILQDGSAYCWGDNEEGQLGQGDSYPGPDGLLPVRVGTTNDFIDADAGQGHACFVRGEGELYCTGRNTDGELGLGGGVEAQVRALTRVGDGTDWVSIATGQGHTCGVRSSGELFCFGDGSAGQLGLGNRAPQPSPARVGTDSDWTAVDVDTFHSCGIRAPGTLHCWGRNAEGQLGQGDATDRDPTQVGAFTDWVQVAVGRFHTCARRANGSLWCAGDNTDGRLGTGDFDRRSVMTEIRVR